MSFSEADVFLLARVYLVSSTTVEGALYGFAFALYIFCAQSLYLQLEDRDRCRQHLFTLVYMTLAMALALLGLAADTKDVQTGYVDHADCPSGGYFYSTTVSDRSPVAIMGYAADILLSFMMSGIQIWRLWIIWGVSRYSLLTVIVPPMLSLLAYLGVELAAAVLVVRSELPEGHLATFLLYGHVTLPLYISITVTVLIVTRIVVVRRKHIKIMGQTGIANPYTSIYSMLIESFSLEFVWLVVQIIFSNSWAPVATCVGDFFVHTQPFIQVIAYLLVVYQVSTGRGWKEGTEEKLTTLQWNRDGLQTSQADTRMASIPVTREEV